MVFGGAEGESCGTKCHEAGGGLQLQSVLEGSPAQAAGLANGDEIVAIDGFRGELKSRFNKAPPGTAMAEMTISPDGGTLFLAGTTSVVIAPAP